MTINTFSDRCNMNYEYYMQPPMFPLETKLNIIIAKNPQLLDQNLNHLLIRKYSHISFNIEILSNIFIIRVIIQSHKLFDTNYYMSINTSVYLHLLVFII